MKTIGIFGTSGFAREVGDIAWELGYTPLYLAQDRAEMDALGDRADAALECDAVMRTDLVFAIGIGDNATREKVATRYSALPFVSLLHPLATFGRGQHAAVSARRGVIVGAGVRFTNNIVVGDFSVFNLNATIGHDCIIEDFVTVSPGACISGNVSLENRCWIGTGAVVNQGNNDAKLIVGHDTMIGSGSVVVRSCDPAAVYVGVPAKRIK